MNTVGMAVTARDLRERVRRLPGMERLLPALAGLPRAFLVGGAVRDLLRGERAVDLDLAVEVDARAVARELAARLSGDARQHDRFSTATVRAGDLLFDLATTRRERYGRPGALPTVAPAPLGEDLGRRDFTINAMAIGLTGDDLGHLYDPHGGLADLAAGAVRVMHAGSFLDDPTRLLRAVRYEARLGFTMEPETERLARTAIAERAVDTVSGARVRDELLDLLGEEDVRAAVERLSALGLDRALHPALTADPELVASASLGAVAIEANRARSALAALVQPAAGALIRWVDGLQLTAQERDAVTRAVRSAPRLARQLRGELRPSEVYALLRHEPPEALALALALGASSGPILLFVRKLRHVRLAITGEDLVAAGVPQSPVLGQGLEAALRRKLDGEVSGREEELAAALEVAEAGSS